MFHAVIIERQIYNRWRTKMPVKVNIENKNIPYFGEEKQFVIFLRMLKKE